MLRDLCALVLAMLVCGCAAMQAAGDDGHPADYLRKVRTMTPDEVRAELARCAARSGPAARLQEAMLLSTAQNPARDDARAQTLAETVEKSALSPAALRDAAGLFALWLSDARKQELAQRRVQDKARDDQKRVESLEARLRDAERRAQEADRKLEALKQIEREMIDRSNTGSSARP